MSKKISRAERKNRANRKRVVIAQRIAHVLTLEEAQREESVKQIFNDFCGEEHLVWEVLASLDYLMDLYDEGEDGGYSKNN